jgi:membrane protein DedA with SNARE-associated domain
MSAILAKLSIWLQTYGPWGVFGLAMLDSMGAPLPGVTDVVLLGIGITSLDHPGTAYFAALMAFAGSLIGNVILFQGVRHGRRLLSKEERAPGRFQSWFQQYGLLTVFVPAVVPFVPLPLKVFVISAGAFRTPFARFVAMIAAARMIRYFGVAYLAIQLGADAEGFLRRNAWTIAGVALAISLLVAWRMRGRAIV